VVVFDVVRTDLGDVRPFCTHLERENSHQMRDLLAKADPDHAYEVRERACHTWQRRAWNAAS
jgi:hypothetical protein